MNECESYPARSQVRFLKGGNHRRKKEGEQTDTCNEMQRTVFYQYPSPKKKAKRKTYLAPTPLYLLKNVLTRFECWKV